VSNRFANGARAQTDVYRGGKQVTTALQTKPKRGKVAAVGALLDRRVRRPRVQTLGRSPDAFNGRYKGRDIGITRGASGNWYIVVIDESGMRSYDGYWLNSAHRSLDDAITEACTGACLWTPNS